MANSVLILGANGRLGRVLVEAFSDAGWQVQAQVRRDPAAASAGPVKWLSMSLEDPAALAHGAGRADVVVHAVNPPYPAWHAQAVPLLTAAIATTRALGAVLMFPGNVYNFGAGMPELLAEDTPQHPTSRKGRIRVRMEEALREAARAGLRTAIIRAGDFFGGPGRGSWFDLVIAKSLARGKAVYPGRTDVTHAWAYLPDLARAFALVAAQRSMLAPYEVLHFPGHAVDGDTFLGALQRAARRTGVLAAGVPLERGSLPWGLLRVGGLLVPMWRELAEMRYLWDVPHRLSAQRLAKLIGTVPSTPLEQALEATLVELYQRKGVTEKRDR
jgi:nucleoside-diphosphate-sugar epimerase